jgi:2-oxoisovalerate dehydrogenase E1 component alpha subunit
MAKAKSAAAAKAVAAPDTDLLHRMYYLMVMARVLDERCWVLNRGGQAPFVISGQGHEAAQVAAGLAFDPDRDMLCPYYRDMGVVLAFGVTPREIMLGLLARANDPSSGGRQMPSHWGHAARRIITGSSPVSTQILHAAGVALAAKLKGEDTVSAAFFGEGSSNQGDFHEGLNFASVYRLPVVFVCENNGYAISVPVEKQMAVGSVAARAAGYGIPGVEVDGLDALAVYQAMSEAVARARRGEGPSLLDLKVVRLTSHSSDDDQRSYRTSEALAADRQHDPIPRFRAWMEAQGIWDAQRDEDLRARVRREVDDATEFALASPVPDPATLMDHVYAP